MPMIIQDGLCCYVKMVFLMKNFLLYQMCYLLNMLDMVITTIWSFFKVKDPGYNKGIIYSMQPSLLDYISNNYGI